MRAVGWVRQRPRAFLISSQVALLGLAVWLLVLPQVRKSSGSMNLLFDMDNPWLPLALGAELLSLAAYALTTRSILPQRNRPSLVRVLRIDLSSIALGHCLPDGGAAGTALAWRLLVAAGVPSAEAAFAKLAQGLTAAVVLQAMLLAGFALGLPDTGFERWNTVPAVLSAGLLITIAVIVLALRRRGVRLAIHRALRRLPRYGARVAEAAAIAYRRHAVQQVRGTFNRPGQVVRTGLYAGTNWAFDALALWACIAAYGSHVGVGGLAAAFAIQAFAAWLPLTPNGLGLSEGLMIPALLAFGASSSAAVLGVLTWRLLAYWLPMPIGALAYASLRVAPWRRTRSAPTEVAEV